MPTSTIFEARVVALVGDKTVLDLIGPRSGRLLVRIAGMQDAPPRGKLVDRAWERLTNAPSTTWVVLETGDGDHLPLVEPYLDGLPLAAWMVREGIAPVKPSGYALAMVGEQTQVPWPVQLAQWSDMTLAICVTIVAVLLIAIRDQQVQQQIAEKDPHPTWFRRARRWLISPGLGRSITLESPDKDLSKAVPQADAPTKTAS